MIVVCIVVCRIVTVTVSSSLRCVRCSVVVLMGRDVTGAVGVTSLALLVDELPPPLLRVLLTYI